MSLRVWSPTGSAALNRMLAPKRLAQEITRDEWIRISRSVGGLIEKGNYSVWSDIQMLHDVVAEMEFSCYTCLLKSSAALRQDALCSYACRQQFQPNGDGVEVPILLEPLLHRLRLRESFLTDGRGYVNTELVPIVKGIESDLCYPELPAYTGSVIEGSVTDKRRYGEEGVKLVCAVLSRSELQFRQKRLVFARSMGWVPCSCKFVENGRPYVGTVGLRIVVGRLMEFRRFCDVCGAEAPFTMRVDLPTEEEIQEATGWKSVGNGRFQKTAFSGVNPRKQKSDGDRLFGEMKKLQGLQRREFVRSFFYRYEASRLISRLSEKQGCTATEATMMALKKSGVDFTSLKRKEGEGVLQVLERTGNLDAFAEATESMIIGQSNYHGRFA